MGECNSRGAVWLWEQSPGKATVITSNFTIGTPLTIDVDCNDVKPHTVVKVLASGPSPLELVSGGKIAFGGGKACLNTGQGPPNPPCGPHEVYLQNQIQLTPCDDDTASGWSIQGV